MNIIFVVRVLVVRVSWFRRQGVRALVRLELEF